MTPVPLPRPGFRGFRPGDGVTPPRGLHRGLDPAPGCKLHSFPTDADGEGQVIGIIELMAPQGSGFRPEELETYFQSLGLEMPEVSVVSVDGGVNRPGTDPADPGCRTAR